MELDELHSVASILKKGKSKMRKLVIGMALASTALASPALARDDSWYVEGDAGVTKVEDANFLAANQAPVKADFKTGYDFGGIVGYDFGMFRLEAEASYRRAGLDQLTSAGQSLNRAGGLTGSASDLSFMLNGLLDFGPDDGLQGFVGGGVGVGRAKYVANTPAPLLNDSDTGFAWQALAGLRMPVSSNVDLGLKYRFFNQDKVNLISSGGTALATKFRSHSQIGRASCRERVYVLV